MIARTACIAALILAGTVVCGCGGPKVPQSNPAPNAAASVATPLSANLAGTSWQLVKFTGSNRTLTPDDRSKYTITFQPDGSVVARVDCNRGHGSWKSSGPNQLELGPLALTRMMCPPGSMHDRVAADWDAVRSYAVKDGHLYLSLMAEGGTYEYEPALPATPAG